MSCNRSRRVVSYGAALALSTLVVIACAPTARAVITIPTVPVGNPGNAPDTTGFGSVGYAYEIGTTEITVGQYVAFLNAVAKTSDPFGLYRGISPNTGGVGSSGPLGNITYTVIGSPNKPVSYIRWGDAARFANWMHNGQPTGIQDASTTEDGSYTMNGAILAHDFYDIVRNPGATWVIPTEDEWYKAAYHKNDGVTGNYWDYPTSSDAVPYSDQPPGSDAPTMSNTANFRLDDGLANAYNDGFAVTGSATYVLGPNYLTDAGAYTSSKSPYGTFDQAGSLTEWNEARSPGPRDIGSDVFRGARGGVWFDGPSTMHASFQGFAVAFGGNDATGFRLARVPEPGAGTLAIVACAMAFVFRRRLMPLR